MLLEKLLLMLVMLVIKISHAGGWRERTGHDDGGVCVLLLLFWSKRRLEALLSMSLESRWKRIRGGEKQD